MKKGFLILTVTLAVFICLAGCKKEEQENKEESKQVTKLIWQSSQNMKKRQDYFNEVLKQKNLPYEIEFIDGEDVLEGDGPDIREISMDWQHTFDLTEDILKGDFIELDAYLNSEEGKAIQDSIPENVWDIYKVNGKQYTILSIGFVPAKTVYIWDTTLAEKYDLHPEDWSEKIWEYGEELKKVKDGEKNRDSFTAVKGMRMYAERQKGLTQSLGICYPFVIRESDEMPRMELLYETPEYKEYLAGAQKLYNMGIYESKDDADTDTDFFLKIEADFKTKDAYLAWQKGDFWDTHEVKEIDQMPLYRLSGCGHEVGITSWSKQPDEAFSFLCRLYEDTELTNALIWGKEGSDYGVRGNMAVRPAGRGYIPAIYAGNMFSAYTEVGQDEEKEELYPVWLEECKDSKIKSFDFSGKEYEEELMKLYRAHEDWLMEASLESVLWENDEVVKQCKEAGSDQVIEAWNAQYHTWTKGQ